MTHTKVHMTDVIYNAANQCFEALVTVESTSKTAKYPCAIEAPIGMSFEDASKGLQTQAIRRHASGKGMQSQVRAHMATVRAGRRSFDPRVWLTQLGLRSVDSAA